MPVASDDGMIGTVALRKTRKSAVALIGTAAVAIALGCVFLATGQNLAQNAVDYMGDAAGIYVPNAQALGAVDEYTSFQSVPNVLWQEDEMRVGLLLANPEGNPVDMVPHVYVDCNDDGEFAEDECVFNPPAENDGGQTLAPGTSVNEIDLVRQVPVGEHQAQVVFDAYHVGTHQEANGMVMTFFVKVAAC